MRGFLSRSASIDDKRVRPLTLTDACRALLGVLAPDMLRAQQHMLAPLLKAERTEFMRMLDVLVTANNALSRAPRDG